MSINCIFVYCPVASTNCYVYCGLSMWPHSKSVWSVTENEQKWILKVFYWQMPSGEHVRFSEEKLNTTGNNGKLGFKFEILYSFKKRFFAHFGSAEFLFFFFRATNSYFSSTASEKRIFLFWKLKCIPLVNLPKIVHKPLKISSITFPQLINPITSLLNPFCRTSNLTH